MFKHFRTFLVVFLAFQACFDNTNGQMTGVSWIFRGTAQQNNTVLTFNQLDSLNLVCRGASYESKYYLTFIVTKGSIAPTLMTIDTSGAYYVLNTANAGTLIYSDFDGVQAGYENFVVITDLTYTDYSYNAQYAFRYINIATLRTTDSATYHCSACYDDCGTTAKFATSGALTIQVNTKAGQARSSRSKVSNLLTYSAALLGASKLLL